LTRICPSRGETTLLAATLYGTLPSPCPLTDEPSTIQSAPLFADHVHSRLTDTATVPLPPDALIADGPVLRLTTHHASDDGAVTATDDEL
jgi:hypothetical protein